MTYTHHQTVIGLVNALVEDNTLGVIQIILQHGVW